MRKTIFFWVRMFSLFVEAIIIKIVLTYQKINIQRNANGLYFFILFNECGFSVHITNEDILNILGDFRQRERYII